MEDIQVYLPAKLQDEVNPEASGDYCAEDGLLHCGVCGKSKQYRITTWGMDMLVPCSCDCTEKRNRETKEQEERAEKIRKINRLKTNSMMASNLSSASFEAYIKRPENRDAYNLAVTYCKRWEKMRKSNQGIIFWGPVGTGKSYTAACIANFLISYQIPVIMTSFIKIIQDIRTTPDEGMYLSTLNSATLLIIDDLGVERGTDYVIEQVYNIIDSRIRTGLPMIITTNMELREMLETEDMRYKRIYDRILGCCYPQEMGGTSLRLKTAGTRFEKIDKILKEGA